MGFDRDLTDTGVIAVCPQTRHLLKPADSSPNVLQFSTRDDSGAGLTEPIPHLGQIAQRSRRDRQISRQRR